MTLFALLLAAQAVPNPQPEPRVEQAALLEIFRPICLTPAAEAGALAAPAAAAGFSPVRTMPSGLEWKETAAWQRDGIRLFRMTDPRDKNPVFMCGMTASLTSLDTDEPLIDRVQMMTGSVFGEGHRAWGISNWTLARRGGTVQITIDRSDPAKVQVRLIAWPQRS